MLQIDLIVGFYEQLSKKKKILFSINLTFDRPDVLYMEAVLCEALMSVLIWTNWTFL